MGDIADTKTGPFGTQLSAKEYTASGIPVINVKNIGTGCIQENDLDYVSESTAKRLSDHIIQENDIVFGRKGAIGRHAIIGKTQNNWVQGSDCIRVRFKPGIVASYVNAQLQTANVIDHLSMNAYGSTMLTLTTDMINSIPLLMPEEAEQSEIAHVFSDIDNLITLHQRKYEKLITVKKSMLEKMFPRDGSNNPEIRFIGFTDPWEQHKLSEVLTSYTDPVDIPHTGYERLGIRSHAKGTFHSYVPEGHELQTAQMHKVAANKFIVNITFGWEHAVAVTDENDAGKLVSHRFPQFSLSEDLDPKFLKYIILDENFRHHLWLASPGGAGRNRVLNLTEMLQYEICIPNLSEQRQIADVLIRLDNLITLHHLKLEKLKNIKQSLLQNMFV